MAAGTLPAGWAVEDGVGVFFTFFTFFTNGRPADAVTRTPHAGLYRVEPDEDGRVREEARPCRPLVAVAGRSRPS